MTLGAKPYCTQTRKSSALDYKQEPIYTAKKLTTCTKQEYQNLPNCHHKKICYAFIKKIKKLLCIVQSSLILKCFLHLLGYVSTLQAAIQSLISLRILSNTPPFKKKNSFLPSSISYGRTSVQVSGAPPAQPSLNQTSQTQQELQMLLLHQVNKFSLVYICMLIIYHPSIFLFDWVLVNRNHKGYIIHIKNAKYVQFYHVPNAIHNSSIKKIIKRRRSASLIKVS